MEAGGPVGIDIIVDMVGPFDIRSEARLSGEVERQMNAESTRFRSMSTPSIQRASYVPLLI